MSTPASTDDAPVTAADVVAARAFFQRRKRKTIAVAAGIVVVVVVVFVIAPALSGRRVPDPWPGDRTHVGELYDGKEGLAHGTPATLIESEAAWRVVVDGEAVLNVRKQREDR
ncbi:MAG: hypothetical protein Q8O67_07975 [Deltaproteobacteria bacterium]|nr:hypothetical protein [Deltaproteobacteria bacterium]